MARGARGGLLRRGDGRARPARDAAPLRRKAAHDRDALLPELRRQGVVDERVLAALERVPRERFVPAARRDLAYANVALPIGSGQAISQPLVVGLMTQALDAGERDCVLEVGTGSGYQTAVLAACAAWVISIERLPELAGRARATLEELGFRNVAIHVGDGSLGWPAEAPYRRILVTAAAPQVPAPLLAQLAPGGRLVMPVGPAERQELLVVERGERCLAARRAGPCVFVPLVGAAAWPEGCP